MQDDIKLEKMVRQGVSDDLKQLVLGVGIGWILPSLIFIPAMLLFFGGIYLDLWDESPSMIMWPLFSIYLVQLLHYIGGMVLSMIPKPTFEDAQQLPDHKNSFRPQRPKRMDPFSGWAIMISLGMASLWTLFACSMLYGEHYGEELALLVTLPWVWLIAPLVAEIALGLHFAKIMRPWRLIAKPHALIAMPYFCYAFILIGMWAGIALYDSGMIFIGPGLMIFSFCVSGFLAFRFILKLELLRRKQKNYDNFRIDPEFMEAEQEAKAHAKEIRDQGLPLQELTDLADLEDDELDPLLVREHQLLQRSERQMLKIKPKSLEPMVWGLVTEYLIPIIFSVGFFCFGLAERDYDSDAPIVVLLVMITVYALCYLISNWSFSLGPRLDEVKYPVESKSLQGFQGWFISMMLGTLLLVISIAVYLVMLWKSDLFGETWLVNISDLTILLIVILTVLHSIIQICYCHELRRWMKWRKLLIWLPLMSVAIKLFLLLMIIDGILDDSSSWGYYYANFFETFSMDDPLDVVILWPLVIGISVIQFISVIYFINQITSYRMERRIAARRDAIKEKAEEDALLP